MMGGTVVMACRSQDAAVQAMRRMNKEYKELKSRGETPGLVDVEELSLYFMPLDLSSLQSTKEFVHTYRESGRPLHVLVCNAGVVKAIPEKTDDGFESMLQVNYLSHFLLVGLLLPMMKNAAADDDIRVVMVSSDAHRMCKFDLETIDYSGEPEKFGITVSAVHPGMVETDIGREFLDNKMWQLFVSFNRLI
ncbi:WWOX-like protein, partial [Mya arenaria]